MVDRIYIERGSSVFDVAILSHGEGAIGHMRVPEIEYNLDEDRGYSTDERETLAIRGNHLLVVIEMLAQGYLHFYFSAACKVSNT